MFLWRRGWEGEEDIFRRMEESLVEDRVEKSILNVKVE